MLIVGDVEYNPTSHIFIDKIDELEFVDFGSFDNRVPFIDVEWLGITRNQVTEFIKRTKRDYVMVSLEPKMFDRSLGKEIQYRKNYNEQSDLFDLFRYVNSERDRMKVYERLKVENISLHLLIKWYISSVTPKSFETISTLDKYLNVIDSDIWLSILAFGIIPNDIGRMEWNFAKRKA